MRGATRGSRLRSSGGASHLYRVRGKRKAVVVDDETPYAKGLADLFARTFADRGGQVVARTAVTVAAARSPVPRARATLPAANARRGGQAAAAGWRR